ncbi:transcriptional regulator with XRE-family HTH domain [Sporomusaceae bacterium BoRhaA]|uniref:helix-turn-helix domain-containing protein n=1 Tax=Pelorhabdus rhamnosifermentans TaxID=2772457 RepID=UPI001C0646A8|nr:helix-turn-helix transcriptional regulator [Pelorhabdus rhamnosifermentans]MBU2703377.1 transcriptional regulator with XRE-family HTH domain [Pelorhabdus rhamnosifermentans]
MDIGARIRELRKLKNLTTKELADMTNISQPVISRLETNNRAADIDLIKSICSALEISLADFFAVETTALDPSLKRLLLAAEKLTEEERDQLTTFILTLKNDK